MKRLGRVFSTVLAVMLALCSLQALAATQMAGRDFNHAATGFPLLGAHAATACETCHVAGTFKGTPRACDGCHALGKRVVATPAPTNHIVTNAPCDTCHFNTYTFLGAKFNHGTAVPGQCVTCHNGRISTGRPSSHSTGLMATGSCDNCHRSYAFLPASWNHSGVAIGGHTCNQSGCHISGNPGNRYTAATATSPVNHGSYTDTNTKSCDVCHTSFVAWSSVMHEPQTGTCSSCHNGVTAQGQSAGHVSTTAECNQCHSTVTWLGALGGMPAGHVVNTAPSCASCHPTPTTVLHGASTHAFYSSTCISCHLSGVVVYTSMYPIQQKSSSHTNGKDCTGCHTRQYTSWSGA